MPLRAVLRHQFPPLIRRFPLLIRLFFLWNDWVQLRVWHVLPAFKKRLAALSDGSLVVDAGSGEGHYLLRAAGWFPRLRFLGIDKEESNLEFCAAYAKSLKINNLSLKNGLLEEPFGLSEKAALVLCIGVLQHVEDDRAALENLQKSLAPEGRLLLYLPVHGRVILKKWTAFFLNRYENYETVQQRQRIYQPAEIEEKLTAAGLEIEQKIWTFGPLGILNYDIYNGFVLAILNENWFFKIVALALLALIFPILQVMKLLDFFKKNDSGNGLFLVCRAVRR